MTRDEFLNFFDEASACFPGWSKWVGDNSPDVSRTLARWSPILSDVSTAEALSVLTRWLHGTLPAPKAYEYENFILLVKSVVGLDRSKANSQYDSEQNRARFEQSKGYRRNPALVKIGEAFEAMCAEREKVTFGQQSQIEADLAVAEIQRDFERRLDLV